MKLEDLIINTDVCPFCNSAAHNRNGLIKGFICSSENYDFNGYCRSLIFQDFNGWSFRVGIYKNTYIFLDIYSSESTKHIYICDVGNNKIYARYHLNDLSSIDDIIKIRNKYKDNFLLA